jgi:adapter protein MecA 1/2
MEFRKIDDTKFQCLLLEEDLEDNNISIDDFFRNDTDKIHGLLDVVMEEAQREIGIELEGSVMSLQLAPQPNHSILLTVSSGNDDFSDMLRQAGERAAKALSALNKNHANGNSNVIKQTQDSEAAKPFQPDELRTKDDVLFNSDDEETFEDCIVARFENMEILENFCRECRKTWGISNQLYQNTQDKSLYLVLKRGRCSTTKFDQLSNDLTEFADISLFTRERECFMQEHYKLLIGENAVNTVKKYCI